MAGTIYGVGAFATSAALSAWQIASGFLIVIILFLIFFFLSRYMGKGKFVALLVSFYAAYSVYVLFPLGILPTSPVITATASRVGLYLILIIIFHLVLRRISVSDFLSIGLLGLILISLLASGFVLALAYHTFDINHLYHFTPLLDTLFVSNASFFWWFIGPAVGLFLFAR